MARFGGLLWVVCASVPADARGLATLVQVDEGPGIKVSDRLVLHPGALLEGRYDSNPLANEQAGTGAPYLRMIGHLSLTTGSRQRRTDATGQVAGQRIAFQLQSAFAYREYFSDDPDVKAQRGLEIDAGLRLTFQPSRIYFLSLTHDYARAITPADFFDAPPQTTATPTAITLRQNHNDTGLSARLVPGGGRLTLGVGYNALFEITENAGFENLNRLTHQVAAEAKWKMLPKTSLDLRITQGWTDYFDADPTSRNQPVNLGSRPLHVLVGLTGLLTPRLTTTLRGGYGNSFYDTFVPATADAARRVSFSGPVGRAELSYRIGPLADLRVGVEHDVFDSDFANYYVETRTAVDYNQVVFSRFILRALIDYRYRQYQGFAAVNDFNSRRGLFTTPITEYDAHLGGMLLGADYKIHAWLYVGLAYDLSLRRVASGADVLNDIYITGVGDFIRHQVITRVGVSY